MRSRQKLDVNFFPLRAEPVEIFFLLRLRFLHDESLLLQKHLFNSPLTPAWKLFRRVELTAVFKALDNGVEITTQDSADSVCVAARLPSSSSFCFKTRNL